jgi:acyl-CoA thioesterase-1
MTRGLTRLAMLAAGAAVAATAWACGSPRPQPAAEQPSMDRPISQATPESGGDTSVVIAFLGDSLTAGLGLLAEQSYPAVIGDLFHDEGYSEVETLNGGVSGDTSAGGLRRAEQLMGPNVKILVVALGGNDALRGLTVAQTHDNIAGIIRQAQTRGIGVLLAGMEAPTNLGPDYQRSFQGTFTTLSQEFKGAVVFVPFLLEGVAGNPALNQADGIHPTAEGARIIANLLYPKLRDMVDQLPQTR